MSAPNENFFQFEKLLVELARAGVDFATVGGVAVSLNGFVRATEDVDILAHSAPENLRKLLDCLEHWGEGWARELKIEDFAVEEGSIRVMENFDLDIFVKMRGKTLDDFRSNLRFFDANGVRIAYLSPADLIFLKQGSWREKDQLDVSAMKEILARESAPT
jgi:acylphosphatase